MEHQGRTIFHAGDTAYCEYFKEIAKRCKPEVALLPIGGSYPDSFRHVHMGPDEALKAFQDLGSKWLVPMHYGSFKLAFENMEDPPRWLTQFAKRQGISHHLRFMDEGIPVVFKAGKS